MIMIGSHNGKTLAAAFIHRAVSAYGWPPFVIRLALLLAARRDRGGGPDLDDGNAATIAVDAGAKRRAARGVGQGRVTVRRLLSRPLATHVLAYCLVRASR